MRRPDSGGVLCCAVGVSSGQEALSPRLPSLDSTRGGGSSTCPPPMGCVSSKQFHGGNLHTQGKHGHRPSTKSNRASTCSSVYKACDLENGKVVALKKVRFANMDPESVRFMAREIHILRRLDHPNVVKLEGLVASHMSSSLYLVFEYMEHDLAGLAATPGQVLHATTTFRT